MDHLHFHIVRLIKNLMFCWGVNLDFCGVIDSAVDICNLSKTISIGTEDFEANHILFINDIDQTGGNVKVLKLGVVFDQFAHIGIGQIEWTLFSTSVASAFPVFSV